LRASNSTLDLAPALGALPGSTRAWLRWSNSQRGLASHSTRCLAMSSYIASA
jgi:hypothetical protein